MGKCEQEENLTAQGEKVAIDLSQLRSRLLIQHEHLTEELRKIEATIRQITEQRERNSLDSEDWDGITDGLELNKNLAWQKQIIDRLSEVKHALRKFKPGTYGFCEGCGQEIDPNRLEILPEARLCLSCKSGKRNK